MPLVLFVVLMSVCAELAPLQRIYCSVMVEEAVLEGSAWEMTVMVTVLPLMGMVAGAV